MIKTFCLSILLFILCIAFSVTAQSFYAANFNNNASLFDISDSLSSTKSNRMPLYFHQKQATDTPFLKVSNKLTQEKTLPWLAASEVVGFNAALHSFDRFILKGDYAQVTLDTIGYNLKHGFVWDNDQISTNMFWHPYTGALYFNSARANGLNFWQSVPFAFGGSLLWECFGESEPASLNDLIATPVGGIALGEITHRVSRLVLDDSKRGWNRLGRELLSGLVSPMDLFNRLISGEAWRYRPASSYDDEKSRPPFLLDVAVTSRFLNDVDDNYSSMNMALNTRMIYGEPFTGDDRTPYDYFTSAIDMNIIGNQPLISSVNIVGLIWGSEWGKNNNYWLAGVFQHFDYYDADPVMKGGKRPYEFTETAAFGGGLLYKHQQAENKPHFSGSLYANLILLGASESDYYKMDNRDYNLGNGYSIKLNSMFNIGKHGNLMLGFRQYQLFTTLGYGSAEAEVNGLPKEANFHYANVQGNKGNAFLSMINLRFEYQLSSKFQLSAEQRFFNRKTHYNYLPDVQSKSWENRVQLTYRIF